MTVAYGFPNADRWLGEHEEPRERDVTSCVVCEEPTESEERICSLACADRLRAETALRKAS